MMLFALFAYLSIGNHLNSISNQVFLVPADMKKIYIFGIIQAPFPIRITAYLYKNGAEKAFYSEPSQDVLKTGPFVFDLISTDKIEPGYYRADLYEGRVKLVSIYFNIER